jgi:uncharacterized protein YecT (DUF1311 family)
MKSITFVCVFTFVFSLLVCGVGNASQAGGKGDSVGLRASYDKCLDAPAEEMPGWFECTATEFKYQDARLNEAYKALIAKLNRGQEIALRDSERKWLSSRDALCEISNDSVNGRSLKSNDCALELTARRAAALETTTSKNDMASLTPVVLDQKTWKEASQAFSTGGSKILAYQIGFITNNDLPDVVLVLDPPDSGKEPNNGPARIVVLLTRNAGGQLQKVAQNDKIVPCAKCGGTHMDDPFSFMRIAKNRFFIITDGGSRERWSDTYVFEYSAARKDYILSDVRRRISDDLSDKNKKIDLSSKDFGSINLSSFDPKILPNISM